MEEIKFNYGELSRQLGEFRLSSESIPCYTKSISSESAVNLPTFDKYVTLYDQILEVINLYSELIQKSVSDISNIQNVIIEFDQNVINSVTVPDTPTRK